MQTKSFLRQTGICGALALILTVSQADAFSRRWPDVHSAPAEQALITQPMFNGPPEVRIVYAMAYEYGEYVRFRQGNMIAEIAYDTSKDGGDEISLRYEERMKEMIEGWHFNARRGISYDGGGVLANGYDQIEYRTYRLNDGHACVAISYAWEIPPQDTESYPGKLLFGYLCKKQSGPLSEADVSAFINGIDIGRLEEGGNGLPYGGGGVDQKAMADAQGANGYGHKQFPFDYGFPFRASDGDDGRN
jgi:hypothetical protein